jgi:DNA-binding GntR family transcriptional regulator
MPIASVEMTTTADSIYRSMRERIVSAEWRPGERLVHRQLAQQFGASNSPVLEALRRLESEGLVTSYPNAGAQVKVWTEDDVRGTFLAREALEGVTCRLFVENASPREKAKLADLGKTFDDACKGGKYDAAREADIAFHLYIAGNYNAAAQSSTLFRLVKNSCLLAATIRSICVEKPIERSVVGPAGVHDPLIEALHSNDPELAERAGKAHVRESMEEVLELFANR